MLLLTLKDRILSEDVGVVHVQDQITKGDGCVEDEHRI